MMLLPLGGPKASLHKGVADTEIFFFGRDIEAVLFSLFIQLLVGRRRHLGAKCEAY